jgi:hypothetical protein
MENCGACLGLNKRSDQFMHLNLALEAKYCGSKDKFYKKTFEKFLEKKYNNFFDEL